MSIENEIHLLWSWRATLELTKWQEHNGTGSGGHSGEWRQCVWSLRITNFFSFKQLVGKVCLSWGISANQTCLHRHTFTQTHKTVFPLPPFMNLKWQKRRFWLRFQKVLFCLSISQISTALTASVSEPKSLPFKQKRLLKRRQIESVLYARVHLCAAW